MIFLLDGDVASMSSLQNAIAKCVCNNLAKSKVKLVFSHITFESSFSIRSIKI